MHFDATPWNVPSCSIYAYIIKRAVVNETVFIPDVCHARDMRGSTQEVVEATPEYIERDRCVERAPTR